MRLILLYLRSRATGFTTAGLAVLALAAWLVGRGVAGSPDAAKMLMLAAILAPLLAAALLGPAAGSPFGDLEQSASYRLPALRLGRLAGLLAWGALALALASAAWGAALAGDPFLQGPLLDPGWALARNLAGLAGLAWLMARLGGAAAAWIVPLAFALVAWLAGLTRDGIARWAWTMQPGHDHLAAGIALALLILGLVAVYPRGTKSRAEDAE